jgi:sigma-B regulation protein RsbU (phosphoserine phosphatase)
LENSLKSGIKKAMVNEPTITVNQAYLTTIEKKVEDLRTLIEVSAIISSTLDFNELMILVMEKAKSLMKAEGCSILLYNKETNKLEFDLALCREESVVDILKSKVSLDMGQGIAGWVAEHQTPLLIRDVKTDSRFYPDADQLTCFTTRSVIAVPLVGRGGLIGVAEILNPKNKDFFRDDDSEIFQTLCRQVAIAIENARFHKESVEKEKLRQELEIASVIQKSFLPESPNFKKDRLMLSAINLSATQVGGDLYDFIELSPNKVGVLIGDVSGKGISAALYMAKVLSDFRHIAPQVVAPEIALTRLNSVLSRVPRGMFLTAIYGIVDLSTGNHSLSVAGHPPFLWLTRGEVRVMNVASGPPLGILPIEYPYTEISLKKGDKILFLTDGVFEAKNKEGKRIGFEKLVRFIKEHRGEGYLIQKIFDYVDEFSKGLARADDLTLVELSWDTAT